MMPQKIKGETVSVTSWIMCTGGGEWGFGSNANVTGQSRFAVTTVQLHKPREASVPRLPS